MTTTKPLLTRRYTRASKLAQRLHRNDFRKGTQIPYLSHLLSVSALVLEHGGTENQAIAALLHDAAEDHGGQKQINKIRRKFGEHVAEIVERCSDSLVVDSSNKRAWWPRKVAYLDHLVDAPAAALLVSVADKVHNARSILVDYRAMDDELWNKFNDDAGMCGSLWYYERLTEVLGKRLGGSPAGELVIELRRILKDIHAHAKSLGHSVEAELERGRRMEVDVRRSRTRRDDGG